MTLLNSAQDAVAGLPILPTEYLQGGAAGLLAIVVLMICIGWLVPRPSVKRIEADRDLWRELALKSIGHTDELLPAARITTEVVRALADRTSPAVERALSGMPQPTDDETRTV